MAGALISSVWVGDLDYVQTIAAPQTGRKLTAGPGGLY